MEEQEFITDEEIWDEIEKLTADYFSMDAVDFVLAYRRGEVGDSFSRSHVLFMLRCLNPSFIISKIP